MSHNGWTNYETWNLSLWIENDEPLYRARNEFVARADTVNGALVEEFFHTFMGGTTPDLANMAERGEPCDAINFDEIATHWRDEIEDAA